jgi:ketosteroid isomerase-like protein
MVRCFVLAALLLASPAAAQQAGPATAGDAAALARLFSEDGYVLQGGGPPVKGRPAIERHYGGSGSPLFLRAFAYATEGSLGYILGGYTPQKDAPDAGKFTLTLRKGADGRWLIVSDMDNSNRRPNRP